MSYEIQLNVPISNFILKLYAMNKILWTNRDNRNAITGTAQAYISKRTLNVYMKSQQLDPGAMATNRQNVITILTLNMPILQDILEHFTDTSRREYNFCITSSAPMNFNGYDAY